MGQPVGVFAFENEEWEWGLRGVRCAVNASLVLRRSRDACMLVERNVRCDEVQCTKDF